MIRLTNGHVLQYVVASGALGYDGRGWWWDKPFYWAGLLDPKLFTVVMKSVTFEPRVGNYTWWWPFSSVRHITNGVVNKFGLTNPGFKEFRKKYGMQIDRREISLVSSMFGTGDELEAMTEDLNELDFVAHEVNVSCPNTGHALSKETTEEIITSVKRVREASIHPVLVKVSSAQDYCAISRGLDGYAEAIELNSVPWEIVFSNKQSPLHALEKKVGGGGGGVSGKAAQSENWKAVYKLVQLHNGLPVIAPSIWSYEDIETVRGYGAQAISFGAIHMPSLIKPWTWMNPAKPTHWVKKLNRQNEHDHMIWSQMTLH